MFQALNNAIKGVKIEALRFITNNIFRLRDYIIIFHKFDNQIRL